MESDPDLEVPPYRMFLPTKRYFEFKVESCEPGARVGLYGSSEEEYDYVVFLGGDSNNEILIMDSNGEIFARASYFGVLQCHKSSPYWVAWEPGVIEVGKGQYPHTILLEGRDEKLTLVTSMALLTWERGLPVEHPTKWTIKRRTGQCYLCD